MRLEQADGVSRSRFGDSLTRAEKASVSEPPSNWISSPILATPTGIEPGEDEANTTDSMGISETTSNDGRCENHEETALRDELLTPGVSAMHLRDLRDDLMVGARALLEDDVHAPNKRAELARVLERAARQIERMLMR